MQQFVDTRDLLRAEHAPRSRRRFKLRRTKSRATPGVDRLARSVRRQAFVLAGFVVVSVAAGAVFIMLAPAPLYTLLAWLGLGAVFGLATAAAREFARNTVGGWTDVRRHSGYSLMGAAPQLAKDELRDLPPDMRTPMGCLIHQPSSRFASAFRDLNDEIGASQLVAFVGSVPDEGTSTAALCVAVAARQQGKRVLIIDCDLRRRSLTRLMNAEPTQGVMDVALRPKSWRSVVEHDDATGLAYIPAVRAANPWRTLFSASGLRVLFDQLRDHYDLIVLDCPPALSANDGAMVARVADRCVIVTAWDETPVAALRATRRLFRERSPVATGVYLNRAPNHQARR